MAISPADDRRRVGRDVRSRCRYPEHPAGGSVGLFAHDLGDQALKGSNAGPALAATEQLGAVDVPCGNVGAGAGAGIFMFHIDRPTGGRWKRKMFAPLGLDAGFFIGAQRSREVPGPCPTNGDDKGPGCGRP